MPGEAAASPPLRCANFRGALESRRTMDVYTSDGSFYTDRGARGIVTALLFRVDPMVWVLLGTGKDAAPGDHDRKRSTA